MSTTAPPAGTTPAPVATPPVALDRITIPGLPTAPVSGTVSDACRTDLLRLDGAPVGVRLGGTAAAARTGWSLTPCAPLPALTAGSHRLRSAPGLRTGIDIDRVVLSSDASGAPAALRPAVADPLRGAPRVRATNHSPVSATASIDAQRGQPFWLVLGQSASDGWHASIGGRDLGPAQLVDGYAMGWRIDPRRDGPLEVALRWQPQRNVWIGFALSAAAVGLCLVLVGLGLRRRRRDHEPVGLRADEPRPAPWRGSGRSTRPGVAGTVLLVAGVLFLTTAASRPWIGLVAAAATLAAVLLPRLVVPLGLLGAVLVLVARIGHRPELAWLALALFAAAVVVGALIDRRRGEPTAPAATTGPVSS